MISVLCPTRLRRDALVRSLESLYRHAFAAPTLEVILAVDPDDPTDYESLPTPCSIHRSWVRYGYRGLHEYYNAMAQMASGSWLLLWNDDAIMTTPGWDTLVAEHRNVVLSPHTVHDPLCTFPIVPRWFVEALGHFSLNAHNDTWWQEIAETLGILVWPDIWVAHDRADITGANHDSVYVERQYQTSQFNATRPLRMTDVEKLRRLLG